MAVSENGAVIRVPFITGWRSNPAVAADRDEIVRLYALAWVPPGAGSGPRWPYRFSNPSEVLPELERLIERNPRVMVLYELKVAALMSAEAPREQLEEYLVIVKNWRH